MPISRIKSVAVQDATLTADDIATGAVDTDELADNAVTTAKVSTTLDLSGVTLTMPSNFVKNDASQTFTSSQRGTVTSDNDLSFDLNTTNNFSCTPTSGGTLTFTNHTAGQSGFILLDNSGGYAITAAATTKINATDLATISVAGVYVLSYFDNGTNAYIMVSRSFA